MTRKWLPQAPADMPDVWFYVVGMIPDRAGAYHPPNLYTTKIGAGPATPGTTLRAWCALLPDDTAVGYIGTTTKLWQYDGVTTFTDRSKGGGYTNTATDWSFAQFGNYSLATNRIDVVQVRDAVAGGAFADCAGTPAKARIICTQSDAVLIADLNDGAEKGNAFAACAPGDHTDWSGAGATTPTPIRHRPGKITAMVPFRDYVLIFKRSSIYKATYTGNTYKWKVELIANGIGAWDKHSVVNCGDAVVFLGSTGGYTYDGASFRCITEFNSVPSDFPRATAAGITFFMGGTYDPETETVWFYCNTQFAFAYNRISDRWGLQGNYLSSGIGVSSASSYRPITGEPAALQVFMGNLALDGEVESVWQVSLSVNPCVLTDSQFWGQGTSSVKAWLIGGIEGAGGRQVTTFGGLDVEYGGARIVTSASEARPGNTELLLDVYTGSLKDAFTLNPMKSGTTAAQANIASEGVQRRFAFQQSAVYARFKITLPADSGYTEILDYTPRMTSSGQI